MTRDEKMAEARRLEAEGLTRRQIGLRVGVSASTITKWLHPLRTADYNRRANAKRGPQKVAWGRENRQLRRAAAFPTPPEGEIWLRGVRDGKVQIVGSTLVDLDDWHRFRFFRWNVLPAGYVHFRAFDGRQVYLHRLILALAADDPFEVDHINRNPLDNRKANLRRVTRQENCLNRGGMFERSVA